MPFDITVLEEPTDAPAAKTSVPFDIKVLSEPEGSKKPFNIKVLEEPKPEPVSETPTVQPQDPYNAIGRGMARIAKTPQGQFLPAFEPPKAVSEALDKIIPSFKPETPEMEQLVGMMGLAPTVQSAQAVSEGLKGAIGSVLSPGGAVLGVAGAGAPGLVGGVVAATSAPGVIEGAQEIAQGIREGSPARIAGGLVKGGINSLGVLGGTIGAVEMAKPRPLLPLSDAAVKATTPEPAPPGVVAEPSTLVKPLEERTTDASSIGTPKTENGNLLPPPGEGAGQVPVAEGEPRVQLQTEGGIPKETVAPEALPPESSAGKEVPAGAEATTEPWNMTPEERQSQGWIEVWRQDRKDVPASEGFREGAHWGTREQAEVIRQRELEAGREPGRLRHAFIRVTNPLETYDGGFWEKVTKEARQKGHDAVVYENEGEKVGGKSYIPLSKDQVREVGAEATAKPAGQVETPGAPVEPQQAFSKAVQDVPVQSKTVAAIKEGVEQDQNLGISALPKIGGTGLAKVGNALKAVVSEIRDLPRFTPFKEAVNRWFGENQKTSLEVRALQKDIESRVPTEARREAITDYLQADGDVATLDAWARASTNKKRKAAYDAAKTLTPDETRVAQAIRKLYDDYLVKAQSHDLVKNGVDDYVTQVWKKPILGAAQFAQFAAKLSPNFKFGKQRTFENFFEGEQLGFKPVTKDISKLVGLYASEMGKTIATRDFIKDLTTKKADDGRPLAVPSGVGNMVTPTSATPTTLIKPTMSTKSTSDYSKWTHPALQKWKWVAKDPVSGSDVMLQGSLQLHPDIAGHVENVLSRSAIKRWYEKPSTPLGVVPKAIVQGIDKWQSVSKQIMLGFFAPFHHVQEATHAIGHRVNPLFDLPKLDAADPAIQRAMDHGLALAGDNAAMINFREGVGAQRIFDRIPILGKWANDWSDFLFHEYIPKLKLKTYNAILERNKGVYSRELSSGAVSIDDVEYLSGKQTNAAFGHLNYADMGRDPTVQHIARTLALAPDFLEARTRFAGQAMKGLVGKEGREQLMAMATLAGTFFIGSRIANKLGDDNYHWEEPFGVIHGNRLYTMRSVPEDIWRAFKDTRRFIYGRVSPVVGRGAIELLTGKNYRGEKTSAAETAQDLLVSWIPITMRNLPGVEKLSPSQANRSINAWESFIGALGVQISRHSPISKTYGLAADYMKSKGVKEDRGSYPVSKYQQLRYALEDADIEKGAAEIAKLAESEKKNWGKLSSGFRESLFHPFTKTRLMDSQFRGSLSKDDRMIFDEATEQRKRIWSRFIQARSQAQQKKAPTPDAQAP